MKFFSGRASKLEVENKILTEAARKKAERIEELERELAKKTARKAIERARELEVVVAQRADLLNEKDKELAAVREAVIQRAESLNEKDKLRLYAKPPPSAFYGFTGWNAL